MRQREVKDILTKDQYEEVKQFNDNENITVR